MYCWCVFTHSSLRFSALCVEANKLKYPMDAILKATMPSVAFNRRCGSLLLSAFAANKIKAMDTNNAPITLTRTAIETNVVARSEGTIVLPRNWGKLS